jgi:outer membrane protein assembly factor BamB
MRVLRCLALLATALLTGCAASTHLSSGGQSPSPWPFHRGNTSSLGADSTASFSGKFSVVWKQKLNDKPAGPLTIVQGRLCYASTRKRMKLFDPTTGKRDAQLRIRGTAQSGAVSADSLLLVGVGPFRYELVAQNLFSNGTRWEQPIKDATGGPIICNNRLCIGTGDGFVRAFDLRDGHLAWSTAVEGKPIAPLSMALGNLIQPTDRGWLYALSPDSGAVVYKVKLGGPLVSAAACGELIWLGDVSGSIYGVNASDGRIEWQKSIGGPIWAAPAVSAGRVYVAHSGGEIVALDALTGAELWRFETVEVVRAAPLVAGNFVIAATMAGRLLSIRATDGALADSITLTGPISCAPITDGRRIFVATDAGRLTCFGETDATHSTAGDPGAVERRSQ